MGARRVREIDFRALTELAYQAGTDTSQWFAFLDKLGQTLEAPYGVFLVQDVANRTGSLAVGYGAEACNLRAYEEYYCTRNIWTDLAGDSLVPGAVLPTEAVCSESDLLKSEYYNDFLRPQHARHGIGATIFREGSLTATVSVVRGGDRGAFTKEATRLMTLLMPHMQRAISTHRRLAAARLETQVTYDALERLPFGLLLVSADAQPLFANGEARRLLATRDGLFVDRGILAATRPGDTATLRALICAASSIAGGGHLVLGRPSLRRPLGVQVTPLVVAAEDGTTSRMAAVFVTDPDRETETSEALVARLYGLTATEAAIAVSLAAGHTLDEAANHRRITRGTARIHLKRVLRKTGTRGQAQLIRRLLNGPATLA